MQMPCSTDSEWWKIQEMVKVRSTCLIYVNYLIIINRKSDKPTPTSLTAPTASMTLGVLEISSISGIPLMRPKERRSFSKKKKKNHCYYNINNNDYGNAQVYYSVRSSLTPCSLLNVRCICNRWDKVYPKIEGQRQNTQPNGHRIRRN